MGGFTGPVFGLCKFQTGGPHVRARSTCGSSCNWLMSGHILSAVITLLTTSGRPTARTITEHTRRPRSRVFRFCKCGVQRQRRGRHRRISARQWSSWRVCFLELQPAVCGLMRRRSPRLERLLPRPRSPAEAKTPSASGSCSSSARTSPRAVLRTWLARGHHPRPGTCTSRQTTYPTFRL